MKKLIVPIVVSLFFVTNANAHKEWVHQYLVGEGYHYLESKCNMGQIHNIYYADLQNLKNHIFNSYGDIIYGWNGSDWNDPNGLNVALGAWNEDWLDPIWYYQNSPSQCTSNSFETATVTHFWKADAGDLQTNSFPLATGCGYSNIPNAWTKAQYYLFGNWGINIATHFSSGGIVTSAAYYNSLIEFFKTGKMEIFGQWVSGGMGGLSPTFYPFTTPKDTFINLGLAQSMGYTILGRIAHLLGDMSVPAHTHGIMHPCKADFPEDFELYMGGNTCLIGGVETPAFNSGSPCTDDCNHMNIYFPAQYWSGPNYLPTVFPVYDNIFELGCTNDEDAMRSLFWGTNQFADFFNNGSNSSNLSPPNTTGGLLLGAGDGNDNLANQGNVSAFIVNEVNNMYANMKRIHGGNRPSTIDVYEISNNTFPFAIRSTAALFYWFLRRLHDGGPLEQNNIVLQNQTLTTPTITYQAINDITAQNVSINCSRSSQPVVFLAGNQIHLGDGFKTNGCAFQAEIKQCSATNLRTKNNRLSLVIPQAPQYDSAQLTALYNTSNASGNQYSVFPNPFTFSSTLQIQLAKATTAQITLVNMMGQTVQTILPPQSIDAGQHQYTINRNNLAAGIYLLEIKTDEETVHKQVVIQ